MSFSVWHCFLYPRSIPTRWSLRPVSLSSLCVSPLSGGPLSVLSLPSQYSPSILHIFDLIWPLPMLCRGPVEAVSILCRSSVGALSRPCSCSDEALSMLIQSFQDALWPLLCRCLVDSLSVFCGLSVEALSRLCSVEATSKLCRCFIDAQSMLYPCSVGALFSIVALSVHD